MQRLFIYNVVHMSDADYHEGYFEGVRNCSQYLLTLMVQGQGEIDLGAYQGWILKEITDAKIIKDEYSRNEEWKNRKARFVAGLKWLYYLCKWAIQMPLLLTVIVEERCGITWGAGTIEKNSVRLFYR